MIVYRCDDYCNSYSAMSKGAKEVNNMERLFESELRVMEPLWEEGELSAGTLAKKLAASCGWNRNTTYTVIKKLVDKGVVERREPGFMCRALVSREEVQRQETQGLISRFFGGSKTAFMSAFLSEELSEDEARALRELVNKLR